MPNETVKKLQEHIEELESALEQAYTREAYYKEIAKQSGRKRLLETRELSQLVSEYRSAKEILSENSEKLEKLVQERTAELKNTNQQLRQTIEEQKKIQEQLKRIVDLDHATLEISSNFINQPIEKIDKGIKQALAKIGRFTSARRISLYILAQEGNSVLNTHDWRKHKQDDDEDHFHDNYFDFYLEALRKQQDIIITTIDDLATLINDSLTHIPTESFQSLLAVPMMQRGNIYGALVLYGERGKATEWPKELITFVKIISDLFVSALERKISQLGQRESEQRYRDLVEKAGLAITMETADGSFFYFNKRFAELFGYTEREIAGLKMEQLIHPDDVDRVMRYHRDRFQNHLAPTRYEFRGLGKNGETIYLEVDVVGLKMKNQLMATRCYFWDITHRVLSERTIQESEERYRTLFQGSKDEIYVYSLGAGLQPGNYINVNDAACARLGYSKNELLSKSPMDVDSNHHSERFQAILDQIVHKKHHIFETMHMTKDGREYPVEVSSHLLELAGQTVVMSIARDTTERKRIEEEVQKSQRFESIGLLAGGIAHDFNNLLSIILGNAQLAGMMSAQNKDLSRFLHNIEQGAAQASTLTQQLLTFSKGGAPIREVQPLAGLIKNAVQLALSGLDEYAVFDLSEDLYSAEIDKGQIRQVIHNLILNSAQAMPNGGVIKISAKNVHSKSRRRLQHLGPGPYVQISIKDSGIGIPKSELQKIFDPYYTTKKDGSGLGLTVAYSIIKKHDGLLTVDSKPGKGTTVHIYLPAVIQKQAKASAKQPRPDVHIGSVIVMDDEDLVLDVAEAMLKQLGFRVECTKNGEELLTSYERAVLSQNKPDLVLMDLTVSAGMGGVEAIRALQSLDPHAKAIVSSGYSNDEILSNYRKYGFAGVVAKPYTLDDLERTITEVLKM